MTMKDAIEQFRARVRENDVYNARRGDYSSVTAGVETQILHTVRRAARRAGNTSDLTRIPYHGVAQMLEEHAKLDAIEAGHGNGTNEAARARRFVRTLDRTGRKYRSAKLYNFLPEWQPLADAARRTMMPRQSSSTSCLHDLMQLASTHGQVTRPQDLPDRNTMKRWAEAAGLPRTRFNLMLTTYRAARAALVLEDPGAGLPDIDRVPKDRGRGVHTLPCIVAVAEEVGHTGPVAKLDTMTALSVIAPLMHGALAAYISHIGDIDLSAEWERQVVDAVSRTVATAVRSGTTDVRALLPADLFLTNVAIHTREVAHEELSEYDLAMEERYGGGTTNGPMTEEVPLIEALAEEMAVDAAAASPTSLKKSVSDKLSDNDVPFFAPALMADMQRLASLAIFTLETNRKKQPERLAAINIVLKTVTRRMQDLNTKRGVTGRRLNKDTSLNLLTYPLVLRVGLPALAAEVRRKGEHFFAACERHGGDIKHTIVSRAAARYDKALTQYMAVAIYIADGLREKNYVYARIGCPGRRGRLLDASGNELDPTHTHFWPEIDEQSGDIVGLRTHFAGDDHRLPRLKIKYVSAATKQYRTRVWHVRRGIVDFDLLNEYMLGTRVRNLVEQGKLACFDDYSLQRDMQEWNYAMFVSPKRSSHFYRSVTGAYAPGIIAGMVRKAFHWMAKHALGNPGLPNLNSVEWREEYERVLTGHVSRALIASYWMGIRGNVELACAYTNDTETQLRKNYKHVTTDQLDTQFIGKPEWMKPDYFNEEIDRIWFKGEVVNPAEVFADRPARRVA